MTGPRLLSITFLLAFISVSPGARADECDSRVARIAAQVGGSVRTRIGPAIKMRHPEAENFSVDCAGSTITRVSGARDDPGSIAGFAQLIAQTTSFALSVTEQQARGAMLQCIRAASRAAGTVAEESAGPLKVACFMLRNYVTMDVSRR